jgi:putative membrane protein insertion efficiency factor
VVRKLFHSLILFYQKFLTNLAYGSCRYYPTCSQYAKEQFLFNSLWKAPFLSAKRILTCNQFFRGGIDYPVIYRDSFSSVERERIGKILYWYVPVEKGSKKYFLVKSFEK